MSELEQRAGETHQSKRPARAATRASSERRRTAALTRIATTLNADHTCLLRRPPGRHAVEVVATARPGFVSAGVMLPLETSDIAGVAFSGYVAAIELEHTEAPLEALAYAAGFEAAVAVPVRPADDGPAMGAVLVAWKALAASTEAVTWAVGEEREALSDALSPARAPSPRLVVAHGNPIFAHGLAGLAAERLGADVTVCSTLDELLALVADQRPDAIACDEQLDGEPLTTVAYRLRAAGTGVPLIAVTRTQTPASVSCAMHAGVTGYLSLNDDPGDIVAALAAVLAGGTALPPAPAERPAPPLTDREQEVLRALDRGLTDYQIARELSVSLSTVKTHARRLFRKLDVGTRSAAVHRARCEGLLQ